jgi:hypothetical protein
MPQASNRNGDWRPSLSGKVDNSVDVAFRVAFDNLYTLRDQANANNSTLQGLVDRVAGLSLNVKTQVVQYKDWNGNNQSVTVVTGVTLRNG